jgi:hypothetical protein
MNDGGIVQQLLSGLATSDTVGNKPVTSGTPTVNAPHDIDAIQRFMNTATVAFNHAADANKLAIAADDALPKQQQDILAQGAQQQRDAGVAAGNIANAKTAADLGVQQQNKEAFDAANIDPHNLYSVYNTAIHSYSNHMDKAESEDAIAADRIAHSSLSSLLFGDTTTSQFLQAHITDPAIDHQKAAASERAVASDASAKLDGLQRMFTGQTQADAGAEVSIAIGGAADAAKVAAAAGAMHATEFDNASVAARSDQMKFLVQQRDFNITAGNSLAEMQIKGENAMRAWNTTKNTAGTDELAAYVRQGAVLLGSKAYQQIDGPTLTKLMNSPAQKALIDNLGSLGMGTAMWRAGGATSAPPQIAGDVGDAALLLEDSRAEPVSGTETVRAQIAKFAADTQADPMTKRAYNKAERATLIRQNYTDYIAANRKDLAATPVYGQVPLKVVSGFGTMQALNPAQKAVLAPLIASTTNPPAEMIVKAIADSSLSLPEKVQLLTTFGKTATRFVDGVRAPAMHGMASAESLGYTASLPSTSLFGGRTNITLSDETAVTSYLARSDLFKPGAVKGASKGVVPVIPGGN